MGDCTVSTKKSILEMVTRGVLYHAFSDGASGGHYNLDKVGNDEVSNFCSFL